MSHTSDPKNSDTTSSLLEELVGATTQQSYPVRFECRIATPSDHVYSNECCYTFHTPYTSKKGILVNLNTFIGTIESMAMINNNTRSSTAATTTTTSEKDDVAIFLRIVKGYVVKEKADGDNEESKPTKLAIGVEGGFNLEEDKYETIAKYSIVVLQQRVVFGAEEATLPPPQILLELPYSIENNDATAVSSSLLPSIVRQSVNSIIHHVGVAIQTDVQAWNADAEEIPVSKYCYTIPYIDNGIMIDPNPSSWKCEATNIQDDNLWLNLSDGFIGGGRKHWDVRIAFCVGYCFSIIRYCLTCINRNKFRLNSTPLKLVMDTFPFRCMLMNNRVRVGPMAPLVITKPRDNNIHSSSSWEP